MGRVFMQLERNYPGHVPLFEMTCQEISGKLKIAVAALELDPVVPYQVRHSAPSWEFLMDHRDLPGLQKRIRHKCVPSLRRYEESGVLTRAYHRIPQAQRDHCEAAAANFKGVMLGAALPVKLPWLQNSV